MFFIINEGIRITTPIDSLFPKRRVEALGKIDKITPLNEQYSTEPATHHAHEIQAYNESRGEDKKHKPAVYAEQIMSSPVVTLAHHLKLEDAWQLFKIHRFRHIPVVYPATNHLAGILSDRDILLHTSTIDGQYHSNDLMTPVNDVYSTPVLTAAPNTHIRNIAETLFERKLGAMPIINDEQQVIGIITRSDILKTLINQAPIELWV